MAEAECGGISAASADDAQHYAHLSLAASSPREVGEKPGLELGEELPRDMEVALVVKPHVLGPPLARFALITATEGQQGCAAVFKRDVAQSCQARARDQKTDEAVDRATERLQ